VRIGVVLEQRLVPVPGGTGRYAGEVAAALARQPDVTVIGSVAWHRDVGPARTEGVLGPHRLWLPRRPLIAAWERGLGPGLRGDRLDVLHAPTLLAPPRRARPLVVTVHDAVPWTHPGTLTPRGFRWHRAMAERVAAGADAVVVPTHAVRRALARHVRLPRVEVVGEGATPALREPPPDAAERRRRLGLPGSGFLLSLATIEPRKGLDVLLAALADPAAPDLPLVVVGQAGWGGLDPVAMARDLGLPDGRVRLVGRIPDADLAVALADATTLVVPSRAEGYGLPVVEGMAAGTPVVTSDDPAMVEVGGDATRTAPVGDAAALARVLAEVVGDPATRAEMIRAGRTRAAAATWESAAAQLVALYATLA
jgi:glycosyltransferase involved in cell wall biosynthesis